MTELPVTNNMRFVRGDDFGPKEFQIITRDKIGTTTPPLGFLTGPTTINGVTYTPLDLTGATIKSQIRETTSYRATLVASFTTEITNPTLGVFSMFLPKEAQSLIKISDTTTYSYDTQVVSGSLTTTYMMGDLDIILDITS